MKKIICLFLVVAANAFGSAKFECSISHSVNGTKLFSVSLGEDGSNLQIAQMDEYNLYLRGLGEERFEFQNLDLSNSSRTYSSSKVNVGEKISLAVWKRESLFEADCLRTN